MSDVDDLVKLQKLLESGAITRQEFEQEKAWILGSASGSSTEKKAETRAAQMPHNPVPQEEIPEDTFPGDAGDEDVLGDVPARRTRRRMTTPQDGGQLYREAPYQGTAYAAASGKKRNTGTVQQNTSADNSIWLKILIIVLSIFITWPVAFVLLLTKKPFGKTANIILSVWNGFATVLLIASIARTVTLKSVQNSLSSSETAQQVTSAISDTESASSYDAFLASLEETLQNSYGDHYSIDDDGTTLTISIWQDGVASEAEYVIAGSESADAWDGLKESLQNLSITCFEQANSASPERHVVLNVLNDQNTENVLLSYLDGSCVYDVVAQAAGTAETTESSAESST